MKYFNYAIFFFVFLLLGSGCASFGEITNKISTSTDDEGLDSEAVLLEDGEVIVQYFDQDGLPGVDEETVVDYAMMKDQFDFVYEVHPFSHDNQEFQYYGHNIDTNTSYLFYDSEQAEEPFKLYKPFKDGTWLAQSMVFEYGRGNRLSNKLYKVDLSGKKAKKLITQGSFQEITGIFLTDSERYLYFKDTDLAYIGEFEKSSVYRVALLEDHIFPEKVADLKGGLYEGFTIVGGRQNGDSVAVWAKSGDGGGARDRLIIINAYKNTKEVTENYETDSGFGRRLLDVSDNGSYLLVSDAKEEDVRQGHKRAIYDYSDELSLVLFNEGKEEKEVLWERKTYTIDSSDSADKGYGWDFRFADAMWFNSGTFAVLINDHETGDTSLYTHDRTSKPKIHKVDVNLYCDHGCKFVEYLPKRSHLIYKSYFSSSEQESPAFYSINLHNGEQTQVDLASSNVSIIQ